MVIKGNTLDTNDTKHILLIQLGDIGDVVHTFPCLKALREHFPKAVIIMAVREKAKELVEECPWASGVVSINTDHRLLFENIVYQINFFSGVRKYHFDLAIDMRRGTRGAILAFLSGARKRVGFYSYKKGLWRNRLFSHLISPKKSPDQYMADYYLNLLKHYDLNIKSYIPEIPVSYKKQQQATAFFNQKGIPLDRPAVALHPFSRWQYKEWENKKFSRLADWIRVEYNLPVLIIGTEGERERADEIETMCVHKIFNLAGKTPLNMLGAVLKRCKLLIGIDSAGIHIAAAVGTPTISIYGPSLFPTWAPRGKDHIIVHKKLPCVPCDKKGCYGSEFSLCLSELTVEEVKPAVRKQMSKAT